jgi:hypothetical protein
VRLPRTADPGPVLSAITALEGVEVRSISVVRESNATVIEAYVQGAPGQNLATRLAPIAAREDVAAVEVT